MSHLQTSATTRFPWYVRLLFWLQRRRYGRELEPARLWGRTPRAFLAMATMYGELDRRSSPIDPDLRALILVRATPRSASRRRVFCATARTAKARR